MINCQSSSFSGQIMIVDQSTKNVKKIGQNVPMVKNVVQNVPKMIFPSIFYVFLGIIWNV